MALIQQAGLHLPKRKGHKNTTNFTDVARLLGNGRSSKQCRERWNTVLKKGIQKGAWTEDEEELIKDMYQTFGGKYVSAEREDYSLMTCLCGVPWPNY